MYAAIVRAAWSGQNTATPTDPVDTDDDGSARPGVRRADRTAAMSSALTTKVTALTRNKLCGENRSKTREAAAAPVAVATASAAPARRAALASSDSTTMSATSDITAAAWTLASVELTAATTVISHSEASSQHTKASTTMTRAQPRSAAIATVRRGRRSIREWASQVRTRAGR